MAILIIYGGALRCGLSIAAGPKREPADGYSLWQDAEFAAATYLRKRGFNEVRLTGPGKDGGLDVISAELVAQVKRVTRPVGRPVIQQTLGAALGSRRNAAVFSTGGFTGPATRFANENDVALFRMDPRTHEPKPANRTALSILPKRTNRHRFANLTPDVRRTRKR